jgi:hypothetical protein
MTVDEQAIELEIERSLANAIAMNAPLLHVPPTIDPVAILRAIAQHELRRLGRWRASLHELSYCYKGKYHTPAMERHDFLWGCAAHSSWGPWQIMFPTALLRGYEGDPVRLRDPVVSGPYVAAHINARVLDRFNDETVEDVFDAWNSGTARDSIDPVEYKKAVRILYDGYAAGRRA